MRESTRQRDKGDAAAKVPLRDMFDLILARLREAALSCYGERLVSLVVFGSVARRTMRPDSDIDVLLVARDLPRGRLARVTEFESVEGMLADELRQAEKNGIHTALSPVLKTPAEVEQGSPLFLDMTDQARILYDASGFFQDYMNRLRRRLKALGARRVRLGGGYYWLLKPDLKPGETIPL